MMMHQARCGRLDDPLLWSERTRIEEERIALQCVTGERLSSSVIEQLCLPVPLLATQDRSAQWGNVLASDIESHEHRKRR